jgi:hypothetical protein
MQTYLLVLGSTKSFINILKTHLDKRRVSFPHQ